MKKFPMIVVCILALWSMGGCDAIPQLEAPDLTLELGPPPPPHISKVEVTNGAGKTVMSGRPSWLGNLSANPARTDLDGTLTIKSTWSDGAVTTQVLTHTPNMPVSLKYDRSQSMFEVAEKPSTASSAMTEVPDRAGGSD